MVNPNASRLFSLRGFSISLHLAGVISLFLSFQFLINHPTIINEAYGWHWQYLTVLGLTTSFATFIFALVGDITLSPFFFVLKNKLALCSAPLEVLISFLYWGLCAVDRKLVAPPEITIDPLADIGLHAVPSILLSLDFFFLSPPWNISLFQALGLSYTTAILYWAWVEHCYSHNGFYPYPIFELLNQTQRTILFSIAALLMTTNTFLLQSLHRKLNSYI